MMETGNKRLYDFGPREMGEIESVGYYRWPLNSSRTDLRAGGEMRLTRRAIVLIFGLFILPAILLIIPLYLKYRIFGDVLYVVNEGDSLEITKGVSSIFCEAHSLQLEGNVLDAYQIESHEQKKIRGKYLKLRENYSTETGGILRTWRYFLRKGYTVQLELCSSSEDSRIMIVQDSLTTCELLDDVEKLRLRSGNHSDNDTTNVFSPKNSSVTEPPTSRSIGRQQNSTVDFREEFAEEKLQALRLCNDGEMLLDRPILKSPDCFDLQAEIDYEVTEDNYYSFNVYSLTHSMIHFSLDVSKPSFKLSNYREACLNESHCVFPLSFMSREKVIAEIRIMQHSDVKDGLFDQSKFVLQSTCEPRKTVYVVFFTMQLLTVLIFSFV